MSINLYEFVPIKPYLSVRWLISKEIRCDVFMKRI